MSKRIILTAANLIDAAGVVSGPSNLVVEDGIISRLIPEDGSGDISSVEPLPDDRFISCRGRFISPGLVNLHAHSPMNIFRGIAEDVTPDDWFNREIWPYESKMDGDNVEAGARLAAAEMEKRAPFSLHLQPRSAGHVCRIGGRARCGSSSSC